MQIDTAGTYLLKYTAEDECGNVTEVTREVVAEQISYRTVLYTDGTLIINEKSTDIDANVAEHGVATNVYDPMLADGSNYIFADLNRVLWSTVSVKTVEFGSAVAPTSMAYWFQGQRYLTSIDTTNLDTSKVTSYRYTFKSCENLTTVDVSGWVTSVTTDISFMFDACHALTSLDVSDWDTSNITTIEAFMSGTNFTYNLVESLDVSNWNTSNVVNMRRAFCWCRRLQSIDVSKWDVSKVNDMSEMFASCLRFTTLDLSSWDTSAVNDMSGMLSGTQPLNMNLQTIYASERFVTDNVTSSSGMFRFCRTTLRGGSGTTWSSSHIDKTYARIDTPPDAPGYFTLKSA